MQPQSRADANDGGRDEVDLVLSRTGLKYTAGELHRLDDQGNVTARYDMDNVRALGIKNTFDPSAIVGWVLCGAAIYFPYMYVQNAIIRWILFIIGGVIGFLATLGCVHKSIVMTLKDKKISMEAREDADVVEGFIDSIRNTTGRSLRGSG